MHREIKAIDTTLRLTTTWCRVSIFKVSKSARILLRRLHQSLTPVPLILPRPPLITRLVQMEIKMFQMLNVKGDMTTPVVVSRKRILLLLRVIELITTWMLLMCLHTVVRMIFLALEAGLLAMLFHLMFEALNGSVLLPHAPRTLVDRLLSIPVHQVVVPTAGLDPLPMVLIEKALVETNGNLITIVMLAMIKTRLMHVNLPQPQNNALQRRYITSILPTEAAPMTHLYQVFRILAPQPALMCATQMWSLTHRLLLETLLIPDLLETPNRLTLGLTLMQLHLHLVPLNVWVMMSMVKTFNHHAPHLCVQPIPFLFLWVHRPFPRQRLHLGMLNLLMTLHSAHL